MAKSATAGIDLQALAQALAALAQEGSEAEESETPAPKRNTRTKRQNATPAKATKATSARGKAKSAQYDDYVPSDERRAGMPSGRMLYALNAAGMLTLRKTKGQPLSFGACWDSHPNRNAS